MAKKKIYMLVIVLVVISMFGSANCFAIDLDKLYVFSDFNTSLEYYDAALAESLKVENQTGCITVRTANIEEVRLHTSNIVKAETQAIVDELINNIKINAIVDGSAFKINVLSKKDNTDYWDWKENTYPLSSVQINFILVVPNKFKSYDLNTLTGNIDIANINGTLNAITFTGKINISRANIVGDNVIDVKTGDITTEAVINNADTLSLTNMTGKIKISIPGDTGASINASVLTGNINGNFGGAFTGQKDMTGMTTASEIYNGGGTDITLKTITGDITVNELE